MPRPSWIRVSALETPPRSVKPLGSLLAPQGLDRLFLSIFRVVVTVRAITVAKQPPVMGQRLCSGDDVGVAAGGGHGAAGLADGIPAGRGHRPSGAGSSADTVRAGVLGPGERRRHAPELAGGPAADSAGRVDPSENRPDGGEDHARERLDRSLCHPDPVFPPAAGGGGDASTSPSGSGPVRLRIGRRAGWSADGPAGPPALLESGGADRDGGAGLRPGGTGAVPAGAAGGGAH